MIAIALAATVHDPGGRLAPALAAVAQVLRDTFAAIALNVSNATDPAVIAAARRELGAQTMLHPQGEAGIGRARRDAVGLALERPVDQILYSDFDHLVRWAGADAAELRRTLAAHPGADMLVIGRSARAFAAEPQRLQQTESLVNRAYALHTGRDWDLMFALRRLSRRAADEILRGGREDGIASDVEWPLLAERAGCSIAYAAADGLCYRTMEEFGAPADTGDGSALEWIRRVEFAAQHVAVLRRFLREV